MRSHETLIGKVFVPPPNATWVAYKHGLECTLPPGVYHITGYHHMLFELERQGERYVLPARSLFYYGDYFGCVRDAAPMDMPHTDTQPAAVGHAE